MFDFSVLVLPGAFSSSVTLTLDMLSTAAVMAKRDGSPTPRWRVFSTQGNVPLGHGLTLPATVLPKATRGDGSIWVIPGLGIENPRAVASRLAQPDAVRAADALRTHLCAGGTVAASCSAVFLLQSADVLAGKRVTTSWWFAPLLQQREPRCTVDADRMMVVDGSVVTAGAALAQADLMLHLLRTRFAPSLADAVSRALLIDSRQSQAQFIVPAMLAHGHPLIERLVARFECALPNPPSIAALAAEFCLSERTLARHVRAATGRSPSVLLQSVRLGRARALLETSRLTVEQVAERVGYADTTALRRLMRKVLGATPSQFRTRVSDG